MNHGIFVVESKAPGVRRASPDPSAIASLLTCFGRVEKLERVNSRFPMQFLVQFQELRSVHLAAETLHRTASSLGTISFLRPTAGTFDSLSAAHVPSSDKTSTRLLTHLNKDYLKENLLTRTGNGLTGIRSISGSGSDKAPSTSLANQGSESSKDKSGHPHHPLRPEGSGNSVDVPSAARSGQPISPTQFLEHILEVHANDLPPTPSDAPQHLYLYLSNLDTQATKVSWILNLLGSFGNVTHYFIDRLQGIAVVGFTSVGPAATFVHCMKNKVFFGQVIFSRCVLSRMDLESVQLSTGAKFVVGQENPKNHRYQSGLEIKFNAPSKLLHITHVDDAIDAPQLHQTFVKVHTPVNITKLPQKSAKDSAMFLAEFGNVSQAVEILAVFHNRTVGAKSIKISFSHTKAAGKARITAHKRSSPDQF